MKEKLCPKCSGKTKRIEKYDCYACMACKVWLESKCNDVLCWFCPERPEFPSE